MSGDSATGKMAPGVGEDLAVAVDRAVAPGVDEDSMVTDAAAVNVVRMRGRALC